MISTRTFNARKIYRPLLRLALLAATLSGCNSIFDTNSVPLSFYMLSAQPPAASSGPASAAAGPIYGVAPVRVPDYLQRNAIVTRTGENQLDIAANSHWAAPLSQGIQSVLAENLSAQIPSERVVQLPVPPSIVADYSIVVDVVSFQREPDGSVDLIARWSVIDERARSPLAIRTSRLRAPNVPGDYAAIAQAMSGLLADLARDIAADLRAAAPHVAGAGLTRSDRRGCPAAGSERRPPDAGEPACAPASAPADARGRTAQAAG